jgi:hypothetical protein
MLASWVQYVIFKYLFEEYQSTLVCKWNEQFWYIWSYLISIDVIMIVGTEVQSVWKLKLHELYELYVRTFNSKTCFIGL